jgi:glycosyltransferase involved in cell wall biosynthesis
VNDSVGIVAIGRNEGERLRVCLTSALAQSGAVVYVDSGSTDGSAALATSMGASVVNLDMSIPFTAARARNEGFARLVALHPHLQYVYFVDGDCEILPGFIDAAAAKLTERPELAVAFGPLRERHPESSVYNKLCHIEWQTPPGEVKSCGGCAMMRISAFKAAGGFNDSIIAGEEPELCVRLRQRNGKILCIDTPMGLHDANITRFSQWWKRNVRAGHAYAQGAAMHGAPPERHWVKEVRSNDFWGLAIPIASIVLAVFTHGIGLVFWPVAWDVLALKMYRNARPRLGNDAFVYTFFIVLGKLPQALGQMKYRLTRLLGRQSQIIEYKTAAAGSS